MPDLRDVLGRAAGTPVAPLDLQAVRARGAARRRHRRGLVATAVALPVAGVVLGLSLLGGAPGDSDVLIRASDPPAPRPTATTLPSAAPPPVVPSAVPAPVPDRSTGAPARPTPTPARAPAVADGVVLALIESSDGRTVTWDQVDRRREACRAADDEVEYRLYFQACYSNTNPRLRTAPLSPSTRVTVYPNAPRRIVGPRQLPDEISAHADNDIPRPYRVWTLTVRRGQVVQIVQGG